MEERDLPFEFGIAVVLLALPTCFQWIVFSPISNSGYSCTKYNLHFVSSILGNWALMLVYHASESSSVFFCTNNVHAMYIESLQFWKWKVITTHHYAVITHYMTECEFMSFFQNRIQNPNARFLSFSVSHFSEKLLLLRLQDQQHFTTPKLLNKFHENTL